MKLLTTCRYVSFSSYFISSLPPPPPPPPPASFSLIYITIFTSAAQLSNFKADMMVVLLIVCRYVSFYLSSPLSLCLFPLSPSLPLLSSYSCLSLVWRASPFARGRKGLVSCLYVTCTTAARSAAQSDSSTSPLILCGYWYAGRPIKRPTLLVQ